MSTPEEMRAKYPFFPVQIGTEDRIITPADNPGEYDAMIADRVALATQAEGAEAAEAEEAARRDTVAGLLDAIENGTATQAMAALRVAAPWLVRRALRDRG